MALRCSGTAMSLVRTSEPGVTGAIEDAVMAAIEDGRGTVEYTRDGAEMPPRCTRDTFAMPRRCA